MVCTHCRHPKKGTDKIRTCRPLPSEQRPAQAIADITAAELLRFFTKLDALKGYHQCPLDEDSQFLTTFITPFGRFKYLRAPYCISSISEHYNRRMDEAFAGLTGYRRIVNDVVIYDSDPTQHISYIRWFLQCCTERSPSMTINGSLHNHKSPLLASHCRHKATALTSPSPMRFPVSQLQHTTQISVHSVALLTTFQQAHQPSPTC